MRHKIFRLGAILLAFLLSSYAHALPIFPPDPIPQATPDQIVAALSGTRPLTDIRHMPSDAHSSDVQASITDALNSISDPIMRADVANVAPYSGNSAPLFVDLYESFKNIRPGLLNSAEGYQGLGTALQSAAIQNVRKGGSEADTQILWGRGVAWKKLAGALIASNPASAPWASQFGNTEYSESQLAFERQKTQNAAAEKLQKEQQESSDQVAKAAWQKKVAQLLVARKEIGDNVCNENNEFVGQVDRVEKNSILIRSRERSVSSSSSMFSTAPVVVVNSDAEVWHKYNEFIECQ